MVLSFWLQSSAGVIVLAESKRRRLTAYGYVRRGHGCSRRSVAAQTARDGMLCHRSHGWRHRPRCCGYTNCVSANEVPPLWTQVGSRRKWNCTASWRGTLVGFKSGTRPLLICRDPTRTWTTLNRVTRIGGAKLAVIRSLPTRKQTISSPRNRNRMTCGSSKPPKNTVSPFDATAFHGRGKDLTCARQRLVQVD